MISVVNKEAKNKSYNSYRCLESTELNNKALIWIFDFYELSLFDKNYINNLDFANFIKELFVDHQNSIFINYNMLQKHEDDFPASVLTLYSQIMINCYVLLLYLMFLIIFCFFFIALNIFH